MNIFKNSPKSEFSQLLVCLHDCASLVVILEVWNDKIHFYFYLPSVKGPHLKLGICLILWFYALTIFFFWKGTCLWLGYLISESGSIAANFILWLTGMSNYSYSLKPSCFCRLNFTETTATIISILIVYGWYKMCMCVYIPTAACYSTQEYTLGLA